MTTTLIKKWLHEPLLHFLAIGALLFVLYGLQDDTPTDDSRRIVIGTADVERMMKLWEKKWQRPPTPQEIDGMVQDMLREEVFYREALKMGLDKEDSVVRRRLAQKLEFIMSDLAVPPEPTDAELQAWLDAHPDKYAVPARISFVQVYLKAGRRGDRLEEDALRLLDELNRQDGEMDVTMLGDSFMFGPRYDDLTESGVARLFGKAFAQQIFALPVGGWQGPVESPYGLHLVRIEAKAASVALELDQVRDRVREDWLAEQRKKQDQSFYEELRKRYQIVVETDASEQAP